MSPNQEQIFHGFEVNKSFQTVMTGSILVQVKSDGIFTLTFETMNNERILNRGEAAEVWELEILSNFWITPRGEWVKNYRVNRRTYGQKSPYQRKRAYQLGRLGALQDERVQEASIAADGSISLTFDSGETLHILGKERSFDLSWELTCLNYDRKRIDLYFSCDEDGGYLTNVAT